MALRCSERLENMKTIMSDLENEIASEYSRSKGFSTAFVFNNIFEESWKLMRDLLVEIYGYSGDDDKVKGPRNVISFAYENKIIDSNRWIKMLLDRNNSTHDYRSQNMEEYYGQIKNEYVILVNELMKKAEDLIKDNENDEI